MDICILCAIMISTFSMPFATYVYYFHIFDNVALPWFLLRLLMRRDLV